MQFAFAKCKKGAPLSVTLNREGPTGAQGFPLEFMSVKLDVIMES